VHVLILGAAGMIGRKLTARLVADGNVGGCAVERLTLADVVPPQQPASAAEQSSWSSWTWLRLARPSVWWRLGPI
jgi:nucleoside-diphosphate-sugar epimerase